VVREVLGSMGRAGFVLRSSRCPAAERLTGCPQNQIDTFWAAKKAVRGESSDPVSRLGAVGFIDWLDERVISRAPNPAPRFAGVDRATSSERYA
jgi:hypothetical protein